MFIMYVVLDNGAMVFIGIGNSAQDLKDRYLGMIEPGERYVIANIVETETIAAL